MTAYPFEMGSIRPVDESDSLKTQVIQGATSFSRRPDRRRAVLLF